jgi:Protein of unknown function (DUF2937)
MGSWFGGFLDRVFSVGGAFIFSQIPFFIQQYQQNLSGRLDELTKHVQQMRDAAKLSGKTLHQYIVKFLQSGDADFSRQGQIIQEMVDRWKELTNSSLALNEASPLTRPWEFVSHFNLEIAQSTLKSYSFGLPLTIEGLCYALVGMGAGYALFKGLSKYAHICTYYIKSTSTALE